MKLLVDEPESRALRASESARAPWATSRISVVEVHRAVTIADPSPATARDAGALLTRCRLIAVSEDLLERARELTSQRLRSLDAIHLASALRIGAGSFLTYDRRVAEAASAAGLRVLSPRAA